MNRKRLNGEGGVADCRGAALVTLFGVVLTMVRVLAPFKPFLTENHNLVKIITKVSAYIQTSSKTPVRFLSTPQVSTYV